MPTVETVIQISGMDAGATATISKIATALGGLVTHVQGASQAMANAGTTGANGFKQMEQAMNQAAQTATNAGSQMANTTKEHGQAVDKSTKSWADHAKGVFAGVGVYTIVSSALRQIRGAISEVGEAAIGLNAKLEQARIGFTTLLGSVQLADSFLKELYQFALKTPFQFPDLIDATKRILAFGFTMKEVIPIMTAVGNASAALGTGALGIDRMTLALGQMAAKGKVQGQEIKQLAEAGIRTIDIYAILADKFGVSVQEIIKWQEQGKLKSKDFIEAFKQYSELKFGHMMELNVKTFLGAVSNLKDASSMIIAAGFEPIFKRMTSAIQKFSEELVSSKADEYMSTLRGASEKFLVVADQVAAMLKGNLNPTLAALGAVIATALIPAVIGLGKSLLILALNPVTLALVALALIVFKLTQYLEKNPEAAKKVSDALKRIGDFAREKVLPIIERLGNGLQVVIGWLNKTAQAFDNFATKLLEWAGVNEKAETSSKNLPIILKKTEEALGPLVSAWDAQNIMLKEAASFSDNFRDALGELAGEISLTKDEVDDYKDAIAKTFGKMADAMVSSKEVAVDWANKFKQKLGITIVPVDDLKKKIELLGSAMVGLSADEKMYFARRINEVMSGMTPTIDGVKLAAEGLVGILNQMNTAAEQAAQTKRWEDMAQALTGGLGGVFDEMVKIKKETQGGLFNEDEQTKALLNIKAGEQDVREEFQRLWEMQNRWKEQDAIATNKQAVALEQAQQKLAGYKQIYADMISWNAEANDRSIEGYKKAITALGEYMAKWVLAQELQGKITKEQADMLLGYYEKVFGAGLSVSEKFTREVTKGTADLLQYGDKAYMALGLITKGAGEAALAGGNVIEVFKSGMGDWEVVMRQATSVFGKYSADGAKYWDDLFTKAMQAEKPIDVITQGIYDFKVAMGEISGEGEAADKLLRKMGELPAKGLKPVVDAAVALKTPYQTAAENNADAYADAMVAKIKGRVKDIESSGMDLVKGFANGMTNPASQNVLTSATDATIAWITARVRSQLGMQSPSTVFAGFGSNIMQGLAQGIQSAGDLPVQALIDQVQRLLDLFGGLHVPSYVGELADSVNSVVSAFKTALEALSLLGNYTPAAASSVEQAYYDMKRIINAFVEAYTLWGTWIDLEKFQQLADIANSLMGAFKTGLEALSQLKEYTSPARSAIDAAVEDMIYLVQKLQAGISPLMEGVGKSLQAIGEGVGTIIEPLVKLRNYIGIIRDKVSGIAPALDAFQTDLTDLSQRLSQLAIWLAGQKDLTEKMQSFGETLQAIGGGVGSIIEPLMKLHDYVGMARVASSGVAPALQAFEIDLRGLFGRLAVLAQWVADQGDLADQMRILGETLAAIMEPINTAIDVLNKIAMYIALPRDAGGIAPALEAFDTDLRGLIGRLGMIADALGIVDVLSPMRVKLIAFGETMQAIMPPLMDAFEILDALREYIPLERVGAGGIAPALEAFETDLRGLLGRLGTIADVIGILDPTVVNKLKELGAVLVAVMEGVRSTIQTLTDLMKWAATAPTWTELLAALDSLDSVLDGFISYMEIWATTIDIPPGMLDFADKLGRIVAPFQSVVSIFSSLIDLGDKLGDKTFDLVTLMNWLDSITRELVARVRFWMEGIDPLEIGESLANYAKLLGEIISPFSAIISVVTGAIELAKKIAGGTIDLITATEFLDDATRELIDLISTWASGLGGEGALDIGVIDPENNPLALYAKTLSAILSPMQTAISITSGAIDLAKKVGEGAYSFINAMTVLREAVARLVDAMEIMKNDIPLTGKPAEALIAYAELLAKVLSPMQTAISIVSAAIDLVGKVGKGSIDFLHAMDILREAVARIVDAVDMLRTDVPLDAETDKPILDYAELLSKILAPMQTVISVTSAAIDLAEKVGKDSFSFLNAFITMTNAASGLVVAIQGWMDTILLSTETISEEALVAYSETLSKVLAPMQTVISITTAAIDLAKTMGSDSISFTNAITTMTNAASGLIVAITGWVDTIDIGDLDPTKNTLLPYAKMLGDILAPMQTVISITSSAIDLAKTMADTSGDFTEVTNVMGSAAKALVDAITSWKTTIPLETDPTKNTLLPYATMLSSILSPMQAVISITSSAIKLVDEVGSDSYVLTNAMLAMTNIAGELIRTLTGWTDVLDIGDLDPTKNTLLPFSKMLSEILSPMSTVISITTAMISLVETVGDNSFVLTRATENMTNIAGELIRVITGWSTTIDIGDLDPEKNVLLPFVEMLSKILAPMQTVISITTSMIDLVEKVGDNEFILVRSMAALTNIAGELIRTLTGWVDVIDVGDLDPVKNALLPFAEMLSRLLAPMQTVISITSSVIDLAIKIEEEEFTLVSVFELLTGVAQALIDELEYWEESLDIGDLDPAKNTFLPFSEMLSKLLAPMQTVVSITSSVVDLAAKIEEQEFTLVSVFELLTSAAQALIEKLRYWEESLDIGDLDPTKNVLLPYAEMLSKLLAPMQTVISVTSGAVDLAEQVAEVEETLENAILFMARAASGLTTALITWSRTIPIGSLDPEENQFLLYAQMLSALLEPMQAVISVTSGAVDLAERVAEVEGTLENAILFMARAASGLTTALITWKLTIPIGSLDPEENQFLPYAKMLSALLEPMQTIISVTSTAIDLAARCADVEGTLENAILFITRAMSGLITALITWKNTIPIGDLDPKKNIFLPYAEMLSALLTPMQTVISITSGALDLASKVAEGTADLDAAMTVLTQATIALVDTLRELQISLPLDKVTDKALLAYSELLANILSPLSTVISVTTSALDLADRVATGTADITKAMVILVQSAVALVRTLNLMRSIFLPMSEIADEALLKYAETLSAVLAPMSTIISIVTTALDLADRVKDGTADITKAMVILVQSAVALVRTLNLMRTMFLPMSEIADEALLKYAETLSAVLSPMSTIISIVTAALDLADRVVNGTGSIIKAMVILVQGAVALVRTLNLMRIMFLPMSEIADKALLLYAETLSSVLSPMSTIMSVTTAALDLADRVANGTGDITKAMTTLVQSAVALVRTLNLMRSIFLPMSEIGSAALLKYAETLAAILSPMSTIISITTAALDLADRVAGGTADISRAMVILVQCAVALVRTLNLMRSMFLPMKEIADTALLKYAETLAAVLSPMSTIISITTAALDLADRVVNGTADITKAMIILVQSAVALIRTLNLMRTIFLPMSEIADEALLKYVTILSAVLSPMSTIISIITSALDLADRVAGGTTDITKAMVVLVQSAVALVRTLNLMRSMFLPMEEISSKALLKYAETLAAVLSPMSTIISITTAALDLADRVADGAPMLWRAMFAIIDAAMRLVSTLRLLKSLLPLSEKVDKPLIDYATLLTSILSPLSTVISVTTAALDLADRVKDGAPMLWRAMFAIIDAAMRLVSTLRLLKSLLPLNKETDKPLLDYATLLSSILSPLSTIISVTTNALDLADRVAKETSGLAPAMTAITDAATQLVKTLRSLMVSLPIRLPIDQPLLDYATTLAAAINPLSTIISVTTTALDLADKVSKGTVSLETAMTQITSAAISMVGTLNKLMTTLPLSATADKALLDYADLLSRIVSPLSTIISVTTTALDLAEKVKNGTVDITNAMDQVRDCAAKLVKAIRTLSVDVPLDATTDKPILDYADLLSRILSPLSTIISVTSSAFDLADRVAKGTLNVETAMDQVRDAAFYLVDAIRMMSRDIPLDATTDKPILDYADLLSRILSPLSTIMSVTTSAMDLAERVTEGTINIKDAMDQMRDAAALLVDALRMLSNDLPLDPTTDKGILDYADLLSRIISPLSTIISTASSAFDFADRVAKGTLSLATAMTQMRQAAWSLVDSLRIMKTRMPLDPTRDQALLDYAVLLAGIVSPLSTIMSVTTSAMDLADKVAKGTVNIATAMTQMRDAAGQLVNAVHILSHDVLLDTPEAEAWAGYAALLGAIVSPLSTVMSVTTAAMDLVLRVVNGTVNIADAMTQMRDAAAQLVNAVHIMSHDIPLDTPEMEALANYAALLGSILSPLSTVISVTTAALDLADRVAEGTLNILHAMDIMRDAVGYLVDAMEMLKNDVPVETDLIEYATNLGKLLQPMQTVLSITSSAIDLSEKIAEKTFTWSTITTVIEDATTALYDMVKDWFEAGVMNLSDDMIEYADRLGKFLAPLQTVVTITDTMVSLSEKIAKKTIVFTDLIALIKSVTAELVGLVEDWSSTGAGGLIITQAMIDYATTLNAVLVPIQTAISVVSSVVDLAERLGTRTFAWARITQALADAIVAVMDAWSGILTPAFLAALATFPESFGNALNNALSPIKNAVDALMAIHSYIGFARISADDIPSRIQALADDVRSFMLAFAAAASYIADPAPITAFGAALNAIIGPIKTYIDTFYWLWRYRSIAERSGGRGRPPGWIPPQFEAIANDVRLFVLAISNLAAEIEPEALAAAAALSTSIQPLFTMANSILDFFARIVSRPRASLGGVINTFITDLTYVIRQLVAGFTEAGSIAEALQTAMDVIGFQGGVTLIDALIRGIDSRMDALDFALNELVVHIGTVLQAGLSGVAITGEVSDMPARVPAAAAPQNYEVNITFTGPIYASKPEDVERLAQKVAQVLGERATNYRNIVVPSY